MSLGNLKDQGNQGKNTPWQIRMLQALGIIAANTSGGGVPISLTPTVSRVTTSGSVTSGKKSVSIYNSGTTAGIILGVTIKPGEILSWSVGQDNNSISAITYDATGTEFLISILT